MGLVCQRKSSSPSPTTAEITANPERIDSDRCRSEEYCLKVPAPDSWRLAKNIVTLHGGMGAKQRHQRMTTLQQIPGGTERVLIATGRYLGEGFDDARLDTLLLTMPVSWKGTLAQYAGRLHRLHPNKVEVAIYDYVDGDEPVLARMATKRRAGYRNLGYEATESAAVE